VCVCVYMSEECEITIAVCVKHCGGAPKKRKNGCPFSVRFKRKKAPADPLFHPTFFYYNLTKYWSVSLAAEVETGNVLHQPSWSSSLFSQLLSPPGAKRPDTFLR
jgi:hypothetical protein